MTLSSMVFETVATGVRLASGLATVSTAATLRYRGGQRPVREAVADTTRRVAARTSRAAARSAGAALAQATPFAGAAFVAAATAWELHDACETMKDLRELEAAFDADVPLDPDAVCGLTPPSAESIADALLSAPAEAMAQARALLGVEAVVAEPAP